LPGLALAVNLAAIIMLYSPTRKLLQVSLLLILAVIAGPDNATAAELSGLVLDMAPALIN
jgi:hypothetical protein